MKTTCTFRKFDAEKQLAYGIVYKPDVADSQGDWASAETIEKMAHDFSANNRAANIDVQHDMQPSGARVVESFVARKGDTDFPAGAWCMGIRCPNHIWQLVKSGEINGLSMFGRGERVAKGLPNDPNAKHELVNGDIESVSLVGRAANREEFVMTKSDTSLADAFENIAKAIAEIGKSQRAMLVRLEKQDELLSNIGVDDSGRTVRKSEPERAGNPNAVEIERQLRKRQRLQEKLEAVWENPLDSFDNETDLRRRLAKCEDRLYVLGHAPKRAELDSPEHSAFLQTGGSSTFLVASPSTVDEILGVRHNVSKADEDSLEVENCLTLGGRYGGNR